MKLARLPSMAPVQVGKLGRFLKQCYSFTLFMLVEPYITDQEFVTPLGKRCLQFLQLQLFHLYEKTVSLRTSGQSPYTCKHDHIIHTCDSISNHCCY